MKTCMFTGHRPQNLPFKLNENDNLCKELKCNLRDLIRNQIVNGVTKFLSGMAIGVDMYAAEIVLDMRNDFPDITLEAIIPCKTQSCKWSKNQKARYNKILDQCNNVIILQDNYTADCMERRNNYMVEHSDYVIAVWNGKNSGTSKTVHYAIEKNLPITVLHPTTFAIKNL